MTKIDDMMWGCLPDSLPSLGPFYSWSFSVSWLLLDFLWLLGEEQWYLFGILAVENPSILGICYFPCSYTIPQKHDIYFGVAS